ncbi:MAG: hypothetical protein II875_11035 [Clostridia bacterium]|jgi:hypothetical protein|nr:hypothetical protein [Clostridia bacterium]
MIVPQIPPKRKWDRSGNSGKAAENSAIAANLAVKNDLEREKQKRAEADGAAQEQ